MSIRNLKPQRADARTVEEREAGWTEHPDPLPRIPTSAPTQVTGRELVPFVPPSSTPRTAALGGPECVGGRRSRDMIDIGLGYAAGPAEFAASPVGRWMANVEAKLSQQDAEIVALKQAAAKPSTAKEPTNWTNPCLSALTALGDIMTSASQREVRRESPDMRLAYRKRRTVSRNDHSWYVAEQEPEEQEPEEDASTPMHAPAPAPKVRWLTNRAVPTPKRSPTEHFLGKRSPKPVVNGKKWWRPW